MLGVFAMTFLTGLEAFLVIGAAVAFVRKAQQPALVRPIRWGIAASMATSAAGAWWLSRVADQVWWERRFAVLAGLAIAGLALFMWRRRAALSQAEHPRPARVHVAASAALFVFTIIVLSREGIHTLMLLGALLVQIRLPILRFSVLAGLAVAVACAWAWGRYAPRLRAPLFALATAIVLVISLALVVLDVTRDAAVPPETRLDLDVGP